MKRIILASQSPGKRSVLEKFSIPFEAIPSNYEEDMTLQVTPSELALILSKGKAMDIAGKHADAVIIGADTFVVFEDKLLGKPADIAHAKQMLESMSGKTHSVLTGITVIEGETIVSKVVETKVVFKPLTSEDIESYLATGEPLGKAGSYAIQGKGAMLVECIEGDIHNVTGIPIEALLEILKQEFGIEVRQS